MKKNEEKTTPKHTSVIEKKIKNLAIFFCFFVFLGAFSIKNDSFCDFSEDFKNLNELTDTNRAFNSGEKLKYRISYGEKNKKGGVLFAAYAKLSVSSNTMHKRPAYQLTAHGKTTRIFSLFMKVKHSYKSIIDAKKLNTLEYEMEIQEGKFFDKESVMFESDTLLRKLKNNDILGAAYRLRTIPNDSLQKNDTVFFSYYYKNNVYESYVRIIERETIDTKFGKVKTIKCMPLLEKGRLFKDENGAIIWITDDNMHLPIKIELPVLVGSIYATLHSYQNTSIDLKN